MLSEIVLTVRDVDAAVTFYTETVGLDYVRRERIDGVSIVVLAAGDVRVSLLPGSPSSARLVLRTADIGADHRRLGRRDVEMPLEPTAAGGGKVLPFADPWGNPLAFWEPAP